MFSPATSRSSQLRQKNRNQWGQGASAAPDSSPSTPIPPEPAIGYFSSPSFAKRPATGTPAPWATRQSVAVRIPAVKDAQKGVDHGQTRPIDIGNFPRVLRDAQEELLHNAASGDKLFTGGIDKGTGLCWIICGNKLFLWSYLSAALSNKCVTLEIPSSVLEIRDKNAKAGFSNHWIVCMIRWAVVSAKNEKVLGQCNSAGVIICNTKNQALAYWPDIFLECGNRPVLCLQTPLEVNDTDYNGHHEVRLARRVFLSENDPINSIIAAPISSSSKECIAIACQSSGKLSHFHFTPDGIYQKRISNNIFGVSFDSNSLSNKRYARSLIWHVQPLAPPEKSGWQFFLLTDCEVQYWNVTHIPEVNVVKLWAHEIVGSDGDLGIKKDLAGQKHIWLLDMQVDDSGREVSILVATFCKDRLGGSSYTQYSLLTMLYKADKNYDIESSGSMSAKVLEKKAPLQVIIPKAKVGDEDFLFSMRLRIGGKPSGSAIILSGDGTATVTNYVRGCTHLYKFDLPYDAGKVLDASIFPPAEDVEEGAWVVLTEKVGMWAIPEKAVLLGGVEPPERSLSRKGSCNEGFTQEEKRFQAFGGNMVPRRANSEVKGSGDRPRAAIPGIVQRTAQDEEAEVLLNRFFCDFMISNEAEGAIEKLRVRGAFEKEGETNIFARTSKSIVDTLAKHWTTTRGAELVASTIVSSLLLDKQQKHQNYLHFLALSGCHKELSYNQRQALLIILEHGEKLSSMIQLRELQNMISQNCSYDVSSSASNSEIRMGGSLWELIQLVGDKARRNTVMLMDRDNAEVFYSKVSEIDELFYCLSHHISYIIGEDQPYNIQTQRAYELSNACTILIQATMQYRTENQTWYPSPEGLMPWNCQPVVRSGLWCVASFVMKLLKTPAFVDITRKPNLWSQLEVLTDILLEAYIGSITTKIEGGEEHKGLMQEYSSRRDELLHSLLEITQRFADVNYQDKCKDAEDEEAKQSIFRDVSLPLLAIAKRHEGYSTLWHICYQLNDSGLLRNLMHDSHGPKGGFSKYVFEQLIKNHQYAKLLRLGEEFQDELANFLKDKNHLLWLHEICLSQFTSASETLHDLALSQDDCSAFIEEQEFDRMPSCMADRRRLLNLSKIAVVAGKEEGYELKMLRIEADIRILKLQEEVSSCFPNDEEKPDMSKLLPPAVLIEMCLRGGTGKLALLAFEIFAWTSSSFRISNRSLLTECWRLAADLDDWAALANASRAEGWSDELVVKNLRGTVLFKAACRCYGPEAETYGGGFDEVLPLRKDDLDLSSPKEWGSSVETILMQHKNFPDAGKLMLAAIMMGKEGINVTAGSEGELAMES